jgi:hypothetical protein
MRLQHLYGAKQLENLLIVSFIMLKIGLNVLITIFHIKNQPVADGICIELAEIVCFVLACLQEWAGKDLLTQRLEIEIKLTKMRI